MVVRRHSGFFKNPSIGQWPALVLAFSALLTSCLSLNKLYYYPDTNPVLPQPGAEDVYLSWNEKDSFHSLFYTVENPIASIFFLHGNAGSLGSWKMVGEMFQKEGYNVFLVDFPGFGNSDKTPRHNRTLKSGQVAMDYFLKRPEVSTTKKLLYGMSLGGNLCIPIGVEFQDHLDGMIIEGGFSSHRKVGLGYVAPILRPIAASMVRNPIKGEKIIRKWKKPLLIIHSVDDQICRYKMGKELFDNCPSTQKELWTIEGQHIHGLALYEAEYLARVKAFVNKSESAN